MTDVTTCLQYPLETRTELYKIACPECTTDDPCLLPAEPIQTHKASSPNMTADMLDNIADAYANEIIALLSSFLQIQIRGMNLDKPSWEVHQRGLYCTQEKHHIIRDHPENPDGSAEYPCSVDCAPTVRPWAHNASRAARNQDASQVRIREVHDWFYYAFTDRAPSRWVDDSFAEMRNQLWLNMHEDGPQRLDHLMGQINEAGLQLTRLGPTIYTPMPGVVLDNQWWKDRLQKGQFVASQLIVYPCLDPGITTDFLDILMRNHFLTALCPGLDTSRDQRGWRNMLTCQQPASAEMMGLLHHLAAAHFHSPQFQGQVTAATDRRNRLLNIFERNRAICHHNLVIKRRAAEGFALSHAAVSSYAARQNPNCPVCMGAFDAVSLDSEIPTHLRAMNLPCCAQFIHVGCFKGIGTNLQRCPLCNRELKSIGFPGASIAPHMQLDWDQQEIRTLPAGMMESPTVYQSAAFAYHHEVLVDQINARIAAEGLDEEMPDTDNDDTEVEG
ncbi:hypothetical protein ACHAPT_003752 [Fusarium lateritium]